MTERTSLEIIAGYLPEPLRAAVLSAEAAIGPDLTELRLYSGQPAVIVYPGRILFLTRCGVTASSANTAVIRTSFEDIRRTIDAVTHYSFHSHVNEFRQGSFIIGSGIRAGISGVYNQDGLITDVTGICFRISRSVLGCSADLAGLVGGGKGLLICGGVNSGKTTIIRDLCCVLGRKRKVVLVDERNEIAAVSDGRTGCDVGILTNVLTGCPRHIGIISAIRSLSPDVIICDELAGDDDVDAVAAGAGCGISFCASVHAESLEALKCRYFAERLLSTGLFSHAAFLAGASQPGRIREVAEL